MVRVTAIEQSLRSIVMTFGFASSRRDYPRGRYPLVFLAAPGDERRAIELTHN